MGWYMHVHVKLLPSFDLCGSAYDLKQLHCGLEFIEQS